MYFLLLQGALLCVFNHHSRPVLSLQYLKESHSILSAGLDEVILLWGIADFSILSYIKTGVSSKCAVALEDIGQVVSLDANVTLLNGHFHQGFRVWNLFGGKNPAPSGKSRRHQTR